MIIRPNIHSLGPIERLDYYDSRSAQLPRAVTPLEAWNLIMADPHPLMHTAFYLRDTISARFGVKKIGGFSKGKKTNIAVGDYLDFFLVEHIDEQTLVLTERDNHLDVMTCISSHENTITITSSVITHNAFGWIYMLPVGPAHKLIVNDMLKRLKKNLEETS